MRLQAILALLCALIAAAAYHFTPHLMLADLQPVKLETMIPEQFGEWRMVPVSGEIITSPEQDKFIKSIYSQVLTRTYQDNSGHHIMLSIAYTRDQRDNSGTQSHKPEICYPAQGFLVRKTSYESVNFAGKKIKTKRLVTENGARVEPLSYWMMIGNMLTVNMPEKKKALLTYGFRGLIPDGLIFRVSSINSNENEAFMLQEQFIENMASALSEESKARLMGL